MMPPQPQPGMGGAPMQPMMGAGGIPQQQPMMPQPVMG